MKDDALEEVFICDPMLGHATLARVCRASDAPARHVVGGSTRALSVLRITLEGVLEKNKRWSEKGICPFHG